MKKRLLVAAVVASTLWMTTVSTNAQQATEYSTPGITNLSRLETKVACAGAITPNAVPEIKKMGFVTIINLQEADEPGANVDAEEAAAKEYGLRYYRIPFNAASPDSTAADKFLDAIITKGTEPAFIHCSSGRRAATMWLIKRLVVDHWNVARATKEAEALGPSLTVPFHK